MSLGDACGGERTSFGARWRGSGTALTNEYGIDSFS